MQCLNTLVEYSSRNDIYVAFIGIAACWVKLTMDPIVEHRVFSSGLLPGWEDGSVGIS